MENRGDSLTENQKNTAPEEEERLRQEFYMEQVRAYLQEHFAGGKECPTFFVTTLGCQMNARDSEKLEGMLEVMGFEKAAEESCADLVLYNTCTVRENANLKVYGRLGVLKKQKEKNPHMVIGLCGCMMQEAEEVEKLPRKYPFIDLIFGTHNIYKFPQLLYKIFEEREKPGKHRTCIDVWEKPELIVEDLPVDRKYSFKSGVNIMFGCNNFCSYCIVPYVRGRERSRKPEEILNEIRKLVKDGVKEVMLLGQNVNSYGKNLEEPLPFARLLEQVAEIEGLERIRFMTSHPKDLSDDLIRVMGKCSKVCNHLHLPLQSGSSRILKEMNRRYTKEQYLDLVERIRRAVPDISLTTDIIVGFPGETEEDFQETLDVVRKVRFDSAFTFIYSRRSGTPAARMEDQVPEDVVKDRFDRLLNEIQEIAREEAKRLTGTVQQVLVEEKNDHDERLMTGRMANNMLVHFPGDESLIGQIISVSLDTCRGFYYMGTPTERQEEV